MDLVSVIIPAYNYGKFIRECVQSALDQAYEPIEVIVVDDGSTDDTWEKLFAFDGLIQGIHQQNAGAAAAINAGTLASSGDFISWLAADDVLMPNAVEEMVKALKNELKWSATYSDFYIINEEGGEEEHIHCPSFLDQPSLIRRVITCNPINADTVLIRREVMEEIGPYNAALRADCDGEYWLRMLKAGHRFGHIPRPLVKYRSHGNSTSKNRQLMRDFKDQVRLEAINAFTPEELFGTNNQITVAAHYTKLTLDLLLGYNFNAARAALVKAMEGKSE